MARLILTLDEPSRGENDEKKGEEGRDELGLAN